MIELVTVVVILAIVAGLMVPRLMDWDARRARASVERVAEMLSSAARRSAVSGERLALAYDARDPKLKIEALRVDEPASFDRGAQRWRDDPYSDAVPLEGVELRSATADGTPLELRQLRLELARGAALGGRRAVDLQLDEPRSGRRWLVRLTQTSDQAVVLAAGTPAAADANVVDLDAAGRRDDPW